MPAQPWPPKFLEWWSGSLPRPVTLEAEVLWRLLGDLYIAGTFGPWHDDWNEEWARLAGWDA